MAVSATLVLGAVAGLMLALAAADLMRHRRLTTASRTRMLVALIFALVLVWQHWPPGGPPT